MKYLLLKVKRQCCMLLPGVLVLTLLMSHIFAMHVFAAGETASVTVDVYHVHTDDCYAEQKCGGSCEQVEYFLQGCDCGVNHTCEDHGCYWEDPSDYYPSGCWHCYCPKGTMWKCKKCGLKSTGSACSNTVKRISCGKTDSVTASITVEKATDEWCTQLELKATVTANGAVLTETPYIWDGVPSAQNTYVVTENGAHTFELQADPNSDTASAKVTIQVNNIDVTGPKIIAYEQEPAEGWTKDPVKLTISQVQDLQPDGSAGCGLAEEAFSFNAGEWTAENEFMIEESGTYTVGVKDKLGNVGETQVTITNVDVIGPAVSVEWDQIAGLPNVTVHVSAKDIQKDGSEGSGLAELPYSYDGGVTWTAENTFKAEENGDYPVLVKDQMGNITEATASITNLDKTGPVVTVQQTPKKWYGRGSVTITVDAADEGCGLAEAPYSWDNGETWTSDSVKEVKKAGTYTVWVADKNGNITECEVIVKKKTQNNPSSGGGSNDSGAGDENTDDSGNSSPDTGNTGNDGAGTGTSEEQGNGTEEGKGDTTGEGDDSQSDENVQNQEDSSGAENGTESEEADKQKESSDNDQKKTLSSLADKTLGAQDDKKDRENKDNQVSGNSLSENEESEAADDNLEIEDMIVKADEAMASANGTENGSRLKVLQEDAANVVTIAASTALLISVIGLLLFLLLMGIRVYTEDENGRYKLLGMRICRHQEDSYWLILPCSMTEKSETGRYRLCPGIVFAAMNRDEEMLVESKEDQCKVSVKISKKMDFRL